MSINSVIDYFPISALSLKESAKNVVVDDLIIKNNDYKLRVAMKSNYQTNNHLNIMNKLVLEANKLKQD